MVNLHNCYHFLPAWFHLFSKLLDRALPHISLWRGQNNPRLFMAVKKPLLPDFLYCLKTALCLTLSLVWCNGCLRLDPGLSFDLFYRAVFAKRILTKNKKKACVICALMKQCWSLLLFLYKDGKYCTRLTLSIDSFWLSVRAIINVLFLR